MVPVVVWPTLILRGVSQPTPNAPEVPRAIGMCLNIASGHVRRHFDISEVLDVQHAISSHFRYISPNLGPFDGKPHLVPCVRGM
jgi:hypothetical protein